MEDKPNDQRQHVRGLWCLKLWQWHEAVSTKAMKHDCLAACSGGGDTGGGEGCVGDDGRGATVGRTRFWSVVCCVRRMASMMMVEAAAAATRGIGRGWLIVV